MIDIRSASPDDMPFIKECIEKFRLDDEDLDYRQFITARDGEEIAGFGCIRAHNDVYELASVGVVENKRSQGIGRMIVEYLINHFPSDPSTLILSYEQSRSMVDYIVQRYGMDSIKGIIEGF